MNTTKLQRPIGFSPEEISSLVNEDVVTQHAENAAFLWLQRDDAIHAPHYSLNDLADLDERVEANLDGLKVAGDYGWEICEQALANEEPGEIFTAAVLAFASQNGKHIDTVVTAGCKTLENCRALISALGWLPFSNIENILQWMMSSNAPIYNYLGIAAYVIHREDPGTALVKAIDSEDFRIQARALRAIGELKRHDLLPMLKSRSQTNDENCEFWAAWSALLLGDKTAIESLKRFVTVDSYFCECALQIILRVMDINSAQGYLNALSQDLSMLRNTVIGAGIIGDPVAAEWLIKQMENPETARVAGEAFSMMTGVDIAYEDLEGEWPEEFEAGPAENPDDEDVSMDADEDLPWPEPDLVQTWWDSNKKKFQTGTRYLCGEQISVDHCLEVLKKGYQRQRVAAALELALRSLDQPLFEVRVSGNYQQRLLANGLR